MKSGLKKLLTIGGIILVCAIFIYSCTAGTYNKLVDLEENVNSSWSQVQNQYQRRYDLIPNLVSTVKGSAKHESEVFTQIADARSKAGGVTNIDSSILDNPEEFEKFQKTQNALGSSLQRLLMITENYPDLKANQNFIQLQDQLEGTENRISTERKRFNDVVKEFNATIRKFPKNFIANMFGFKQKAYFTAQEESQTAPKVEF